jgi:glutamine amidotransferase
MGPSVPERGRAGKAVLPSVAAPSRRRFRAMCRIFGFRSVIQSQVHRSLVSADNALVLQSDRHPDGWGVAYYNAGAPHVIKSVATALDDALFRRVSGIVSSETVLAHLRKATHGTLSIVNTHPFQYGPWVFVHNGNVAGFDRIKPELLARIPPVLRRFILGDTDSEVLFYLLLGNMARRGELQRPGYPIADLIAAVHETIADVVELAGPMHDVEDGPAEANYLTFVVTNGTTMVAHQGGKPLHFTTWKKKCPERDECPSFGPECERPTEHGFVKHLVVSSEPLQGENVWTPLAVGDIVGVDWRMQLSRARLEVASVPS